MKLASLPSRISAATTAVALTVALFATNHTVTVAFFSVAAVAFVGVIAARDYAPRARRWQPSVVTANRPQPRRAHRFRLAA
jgi:hypothetical protein